MAGNYAAETAILLFHLPVTVGLYFLRNGFFQYCCQFFGISHSNIQI